MDKEGESIAQIDFVANLGMKLCEITRELYVADIKQALLPHGTDQVSTHNKRKHL